MKDKCNVCKVTCEISRSDRSRGCAFEHNGDENICPFDARYLDLSKHDKQVRADALKPIQNFIEEYDGALIISDALGVLSGQRLIDELKEIIKEQLKGEEQ